MEGSHSIINDGCGLMVIPSANLIFSTTFPSCPLDRYLGLIEALTFKQSASSCANPPANKKTEITSPITVFLTDSPDVYLANRMVLLHPSRVKFSSLSFSLAIEYIIAAESKS